MKKILMAVATTAIVATTSLGLAAPADAAVYQRTLYCC